MKKPNLLNRKFATPARTYLPAVRKLRIDGQPEMFEFQYRNGKTEHCTDANYGWDNLTLV
jgi:hypothetical protein